MPKYRKRPVVIEAVQVDLVLRSRAGDWSGLPAWLEKAYDAGDVIFTREGADILTSEGVMRGDRGDWIIQGVKGELYPCKPDIFAATYDEVDPDFFDAEDQSKN